MGSRRYYSARLDENEVLTIEPLREPYHEALAVNLALTYHDVIYFFVDPPPPRVWDITITVETDEEGARELAHDITQQVMMEGFAGITVNPTP